MPMLRLRSGVWLLGALLALTPTSASALPAVQHTIQFFGCDVGAEDLLVRARPVTRVDATPTELSPSTLPFDRIDFNPSSGSRMIHPVNTGSPGSFAFVFEDLDPTTVYRIGIKLQGRAAQQCPRLAWYSNREALFVAGNEPLQIRGFALQSDLEILGAAQGRGQESWVPSDNIDFADPTAAVKSFRWRTSVPGADGGVMQVSVVPFPKPDPATGRFDPCATPGIVYSRSFQAAASGWTDIGSVNFNQLLVDQFSETGLVNPDTILRLQLGMPLYVRVVPTRTGRLLCDPADAGAPSEALLAQILKSIAGVTEGPAITLEKATYTLPVIDPHHPKWGVTERCYRIIKPHPAEYEAQYGVFPFHTNWDFYLVAKGIADGAVGQTFCINLDANNDDGWFESLTSSVTAFVGKIVDGIGQLVDFAASVWDDIKAHLVDAVADGLDGLGVIDCDQTCRDGLMIALELAMASMGVPPSLPNFEELQQMGVDYLAAQAAEATGVPGPIADLATNKAKEFVEKAAASMRQHYSVPGLPEWLAPDILLEPAVVTLHLWGTGFPLATRPLLIRKSDSMFTLGNTLLPRRLPAPSQPSLQVPMVLPPNLEGLKDPEPGHTEYGKAVWFKDHWYAERFVNSCYHLVVTALGPGDVIPLVNAMFTPDKDPIQACSK